MAKAEKVKADRKLQYISFEPTLNGYVLVVTYSEEGRNTTDPDKYSIASLTEGFKILKDLGMK